MNIKYNNKEIKLILLTLAGSRLYGTSTETSDWDYRGIYIESVNEKIGLYECSEQIDDKQLYSKYLKPIFPELHESDDITLFEIRKFCRLAADNNPNILDILFADEESIIYITEEGKELLAARDLFISKKAKFTFSGYAYSQLNRLKGHKKHITEYPETGNVLLLIEKLYKENNIDFNWIKDYFGGSVANYIIKQYGEQSGKTPNPELSIKEFQFLFSTFYNDSDITKYFRPHISDFSTIKDLNFRTIKDKTDLYKKKLVLQYKSEYISQGENTYFIYCSESMKSGIFDRPGNFKKVEITEDEIEENNLQPFFIITVAKNEHNIAVKKWNELWDWKIGRNVERGKLEDKIGYDAKAASYLIRLLISINKILEKNNFNPRLYEDDLKLIISVRRGEILYNNLIKIAEELESNLDILYNTSKLQKEPKRNEINKLLIKLSKINI